jgi:hypothetical protein
MSRRRPSHRARRPLPKVAAYRGRFGTAEAERLLWRAGFGPRPGEVERFAAMGLDRAVRTLTRPAGHALHGPAPVVDGAPLAPQDAWGHDVLWWMDRMIRSQAPLVERMTLVWHDWFATSRASVDARWMLRQNELFRKHGLGSFRSLLKDVTRDPAMLLWLNGTSNNRWAPNAATPRATCARSPARSPASAATGHRAWAHTTSATTRPSTTRA